MDAELTAEELKAYQLLNSILHMSFHPEDPASPYGAMLVLENRRSMIPNDLSLAQVIELGKVATSFEHAGIRARVSDIAWLQNRRHRQMADLAITSYAECVNSVLSGVGRHEFSELGELNFQTISLLRRAFQISKAVKGKNAFPEVLVKLVLDLTERAELDNDASLYARILNLAYDYSIGDVHSYAKKAEAGSQWEDIGPHAAKELLDVAIRGYRRFQLPDDENRCHFSKTEKSVEIANAGKTSAMFSASWLSTAISEVRLARGPAARLMHEDLRLKLREAQERIHFEMQSHSTEIDLSDIADHHLARVSGLSWGRALAKIATLSFSRDPEELKQEAREMISEFPLSSIMGGEIVDGEGKTVARRPGIGGGDDETAILSTVAQNLTHHRTVMVSGAWLPVRRAIQAATTIEQEDFQVICDSSPFVPNGFEEVFSLGFARLFQGDMISASSILLPLLENSLRHVLKLSGKDTSKIEADMTQEDRSLSNLIEHSRSSLEEIFGQEIIFELDLLFASRLGPALRHEQAHGKLTVGHCYGADVVYACWFIFHITCLPLLTDWKPIEDEINTRAKGRSTSSEADDESTDQ